MREERVRLTVDGSVAHLRLVRPQAVNAIDLRFGHELKEAATAAARSGARAVVLEAEGQMFCGGGDLKGFSAAAALGDHLADVATALHEGLLALVEVEVPVVAAVQGAAAGAGLGLVCCADLVVAGASARFVMAYTGVGLSPDGSTSFFLPRIVGLRRALELTFTNRVLSADEALAWGLVNRVVADAEVNAVAAEVAGALAGGPTGALARSKRLLREADRHSLAEHLAAEVEALRASGDSADGREGVAAFVAKRPARFGA